MGSNQTISTTVTGPIFGNGGAIAVTNTGKIFGKDFTSGVEALSASITTLSNSGAINGGFDGGAGVFIAAGELIGTLSNAIGANVIGGGGTNTGGAGVSNAGTITTLSNSGLISGGAAAAPTAPARGCRTSARSRR